MQILPNAQALLSIEPVSSFKKLPHEVHVAIFSHLMKTQDFCSLKLTCKHFYHIFSDDTLWKIFFHKIYPQKKLSLGLSYQQQFQSLYKINQNWNRDFANIVEIKPHYTASGFVMENSEIHVKDQRVFSIDCNKSIEVRHIRNGTLETTLDGISGVDDVVIRSSEHFLQAWFGGFECCHDLKIWSLEDLRFLGTIKNCLSDYKIIDDCVVGKKYSMTYDRPPELTVWNTKGEILFSFGDAKLFEVSEKLVIYADSKLLKIVNRNDYKLLKEIKIFPPSCLTVTENHIVLGHENGNVTLYNKYDGSLIQEIESVHTRVLSVQGYKNLFLIRYADRINAWNQTTQSFVYSVECVSYPFVIEGDRLYITLLNGGVEIRNVEDGKFLLSIAEEESSQRIIRLVTDEDRIFIQDENHLRVFNKETGRLILKLDCKAFALESYRLVTWYNQKITIRDYS